ncbi:YggS family pyridoxal phosphate-dependent enzyme [Pseudoalteromonas xiamenensis]|uniref:Pyridoxal phosphate homeostasis protein n=1 Tax=Pseudoalteromonas xiamenensis TaxID=882626 RepID=A0A975DIE3_9GAMM|nr:YggS family pyridoxal phosphate-dependent enzyme [Pseudoalteromonas xiamenensis]QTH72436.1 YggS family pyridoxal phosphate-dependent enzyme [Pseudoalteromonas xiamenensis]
MVTIAERLNSAYQRLQDAAEKSSYPHPVRLLAVSKTKPIESIQAAYDYGQRCFGESYVQEAIEKVQYFANTPDMEWHFIGPIQSNKSRPIAEHFHWVQSVDREKIAKRLDEQRPLGMPALQVLIQVNISSDPAKSGCMPDEIASLAKFIASAEKLTLRGLMTITELTDDKNKQLNYFQQMRQCFDTLRVQYPEVDTLSMGMSGDLEQAVQAGSTMVRIGTDIFGQRQ